MNRILFVLLAGLILSTVVNGCGGPCHNYWAPIDHVSIWADNSSPPEYFLYVVSGCFTCDTGSDYEVKHAGNTTIIVEIWNGTCDYDCPPDGPPDSYLAQNISLGSDFVTGVNYTVEVNDVIETFIA
jgi:hypothetical protein